MLALLTNRSQAPLTFSHDAAGSSYSEKMKLMQGLYGFGGGLVTSQTPLPLGHCGEVSYTDKISGFGFSYGPVQPRLYFGESF